MAATKLSLAQFAIVTATKSYLSGVAFGAAFRMQGMTKAVEARDLIDKAAGEVDAVTAKAIKSLQQAISNQWAFAGEVVAKLSEEERKSIKACGDSGTLDRIIETMKAHMTKLGFNDFTLGNLKDFYAFNSAQEISDFREEQAKREAEAAAIAEEQAANDAAETATEEATAQSKAADKPEKNVANDAMAVLQNATRDDVMTVVGHLLATLGNADIATLLSDAMGSFCHEELHYLGEAITARKAAIVVVNDAAATEVKLADSKRKQKLKSLAELANVA